MEEQKNNQNETVETAVKSVPAPEAPKEKERKNVGADEYKAMIIVGYIIPLLFFIPLITDAKDNEFAKFHANQQLLLLIAVVVVNVVGGIIPIIGWSLLMPLGVIAFLVFAIMGIINVANGEMKSLPLIGEIVILK